MTLLWICIGILVLYILMSLGDKALDKSIDKRNDLFKIQVNEKLIELKKYYNINKFFISEPGYSDAGLIAFCNAEAKMYIFNPDIKTLKIIEYINIVKYEIKIERHSVYFWDEKMNRYSSGWMNDSNSFDLLVETLDQIVKKNYSFYQKKYAQIATIPQTAVLLKIKRCEKYSYLGATVVWGWVENEIFYLLPKFELPNYRWLDRTYNLTSIKIKDIANLSQEGSIHYTTSVQGGGGGGSSLKGAIRGGLIAGEIGAIIGSRKEVETITSSVSQVDDRATHMKIIDNNSLYEIIFEYDDYYLLSNLFAIK